MFVIAELRMTKAVLRFLFVPFLFFLLIIFFIGWLYVLIVDVGNLF